MINGWEMSKTNDYLKSGDTNSTKKWGLKRDLLIINEKMMKNEQENYYLKSGGTNSTKKWGLKQDLWIFTDKIMKIG